MRQKDNRKQGNHIFLFLWERIKRELTFVFIPMESIWKNTTEILKCGQGHRTWVESGGFFIELPFILFFFPCEIFITMKSDYLHTTIESVEWSPAIQKVLIRLPNDYNYKNLQSISYISTSLYLQLVLLEKLENDALILK